MAQAICRCGQPLVVEGEGVVRIICPRCEAKVRVRVRPMDDAPTTVPAPGPEAAPADPFIRFYCPCGRRLKVHAADYHSHGKCPDCQRIVPVPPPPVPAPEGRAGRTRLDAGHPETPTADLDPADLAVHRRWCREHLHQPPEFSEASGSLPPGSSGSAQVSLAKLMANHKESGLRICPGCRQPVHMAAEVCRLCGTAMPRR